MASCDELPLADRELEALLALLERLVDISEGDGALHEISLLVARAMRADRCSVILEDPELRDAFLATVSSDPEVREQRFDLDAHPDLRDVLARGRPAVLTGLAAEPLAALPGGGLGRGASVTLLPIRIDARVRGVLILRDQAPRAALEPREERFAAGMARATAIAIRNLRLLETIRGTSERRMSERLKAERRLRQIEKYQRFFDFAGDGLMIVDDGGRILLANRAARTILGFDAAAISQVTLYDIVDPAARDTLDTVVASIRSGRYQTDRDLPVIRASGQLAILSLTTAALEDVTPTGDLPHDLAAIISIRDVTATRRMEQELRQTKDFLLNLIESSADAIVAADMDGRILIFNKVAERITGYPASRAIGSGVTMLYPPGVAYEIMRDLRSESYGGVGKLQDRRQSLMTASGELVPISLAAAIVYDQGREVATVGIFSDLRERLKLEETLQRAQRQLELSERQSAVVELAGAAAHELNQPLTSIMGSSELMVRKLPPDSPGFAAMKTILGEAERMAEIVRKLGQITKYETKPYLGKTNILDLDAASTVRSSDE